jgi:hypothetical protein
MQATVLAAPPDLQAAVDRWLAATAAAGPRAVVLEGAFAPLELPAGVAGLRLPAGCVCCLGQVPLRVGLVRLVRAARPQALLLVVTLPQHAARVRALLADGSLGARFAVDAVS